MLVLYDPRSWMDPRDSFPTKLPHISPCGNCASAHGYSLVASPYQRRQAEETLTISHRNIRKEKINMKDPHN